MKTIKWFLITMILVATPLISGCGTMKAYPGPELPKDKLALIKDRGTFMHGVSVLKVDGEKTGFHGSAEVAPGDHTLEVRMQKFFLFWSETAYGVVQFTAEAGREYQVDAVMQVRFRNPTAWFWIDDVESGKVIGGRKPE